MSLRPAATAALFLALALVIASCSPTSDDADNAEAAEAPAVSDATILALGDSIFEWNGDQSIPAVLGQTLNRPVLNAAVSGAHFDLPSDDEEAAAEGLDIRRQYDNVGRTGFEWVVLDGGGNDVNDSCGCGACDDELDAMLGPDGTTGTVADFVNRVVADGSKVMFVGYYEIPADAQSGFAECDDELDVHSERLAQMAESIDGAYFVSAADVVSAADAVAYETDRVHPSVEGSRIVGQYVADAILAAE